MKHVYESLNQYYDFKFFKVFEDEEKTELKDKESQGLAVIDKIAQNFDKFKKEANGEILKYKEFWEENKKAKEAFIEAGEGNVYKMFDSDYVIGVLELPAETLSDGSIEGGLGATDEPEEEIIEGPELGVEDAESTEEAPVESEEDFLEERPVTEAFEEEGIDLDMNLDTPPTEEEGLELDMPGSEVPAPAEEPTDLPAEEPKAEEPISSEEPNLNAPQKYFVVYDMAGNEREEILRCGSNNVVNAFDAFYNDTFKGSMKNAILQYKQKKEEAKKESEKSEKTKAEKEKESKLDKFLGQ